MLLAVIGIALALALPALSDPRGFLEGDFDGRNSTTQISMPIQAPIGVNMRLSGVQIWSGHCPTANDVLWWYDQNRYRSGESFLGLTYWADISAASAGHYALTLPAAVPVSFTGRFSAVDAKCGDYGEPLTSTVAVLAPAANTYTFEIGFPRGALSLGYGELGGTLLLRKNLLSPATIEQYLPQGIYEITLAAGSQGDTSWTLTLDDHPPRLGQARISQASGVPGQVALARFTTTESGALNASVFHGGSPVRTLITKATVGVGPQTVTWDGRLISGDAAPEGTYLIRLTETDWRNRQVTGDIPYFLAQTPQDATRGRAAVGKTARREGPSVLCKALKFS